MSLCQLFSVTNKLSLLNSSFLVIVHIKYLLGLHSNFLLIFIITSNTNGWFSIENSIVFYDLELGTHIQDSIRI